MNPNDLLETWQREEQQPFTGWDFGHLDGRMIEEQAPWSYSSRAAELMRRSSSVIDLGTGGGERLLKLRDHWPPKVVVTEDYPPNVWLATERLSPFGVRVVDVPLTDYDPLPFADGEFDLVLNRHAGFNAGEVARILAPGGAFLTQQIHGLWAIDLIAAFDAKPQWPDSTLDKYVPQLTAAGLTIVDTQEWSGRLSFTDVGAIVYYLKAVPWLVPGFTVDTHANYLLALQRRLDTGDPLTFVARKYLIEAHRVQGVTKSMTTQQITITRPIQALPSRVYAAFTRPEGWCEWCAERAEVDARVGGKLHIYTEGYNAYGEFTMLDQDRAVAFTWDGDGEPPTLIHVSLDGQDDSTMMTFKVTGLGSEQDWAGFAELLERIWERVLNNLKAVLDTRPET